MNIIELPLISLTDVDYDIIRLMFNDNMFRDYIISFSKFINNKCSRYDSIELNLQLINKNIQINTLINSFIYTLDYNIKFTDILSATRLRKAFRNDINEIISLSNSKKSIILAILTIYDDIDKLNNKLSRYSIELTTENINQINKLKDIVKKIFIQRVNKIKLFIGTYKSILNYQLSYSIVIFPNKIVIKKDISRNHLINELTDVIIDKCSKDIIFENDMKKYILYRYPNNKILKLLELSNVEIDMILNKVKNNICLINYILTLS